MSGPTGERKYKPFHDRRLYKRRKIFKNFLEGFFNNPIIHRLNRLTWNAILKRANSIERDAKFVRDLYRESRDRERVRFTVKEK